MPHVITVRIIPMLIDTYCKQCSKFLCPQCLHTHSTWKEFTCHETINLEEVASTVYQLPQVKQESRQESIQNCTDHNKPMEIFCETCEQLICQHCTVKKHKDQDYDVVSDAYHKHEDEITKLSIQPLNHEKDQLTEAKKILEHVIDEITQQARTTDEEIHNMIGQIKNHLDETGKKLKEKVGLAKKHKIGVLQDQLKEVDTLSLVTECIDHVEQCMKVATPYQILSTKSQMLNRTRSVIKQVNDKSFKPLEQADIKLVKNRRIHQLHKNIGDVKYTCCDVSSAKVNDNNFIINIIIQCFENVTGSFHVLVMIRLCFC